MFQILTPDDDEGSRALPSTSTNVSSEVLTPSKIHKKWYLDRKDYTFLDATFTNLKASKKEILERLEDQDVLHRLTVGRTVLSRSESAKKVLRRLESKRRSKATAMKKRHNLMKKKLENIKKTPRK